MAAGRVGGSLEADHRPEDVGVVERQVDGEVTADRAPHEHRPLQAELQGERHRDLHEEVFGQAVLAAPPLDPGRRHRLAVVGEVVGDHAELAGERRVLEDVAPLSTVAAGGVLEEERDARTVLLEVDPIHDGVDGEVYVAARRPVEARHGLSLRSPRGPGPRGGERRGSRRRRPPDRSP